MLIRPRVQNVSRASVADGEERVQLSLRAAGRLFDAPLPISTGGARLLFVFIYYMWGSAPRPAKGTFEKVPLEPSKPFNLGIDKLEAYLSKGSMPSCLLSALKR